MTEFEQEVEKALTWADDRYIDRLLDDPIRASELLVWLAPRVAKAIEAAIETERSNQAQDIIVELPSDAALAELRGTGP